METQDPTEWDLDTATVQMLIDRFYFREICDDERMQRYWNRTLDTVRDRYRDILRIETIKFDPLVSKYFEGEYTVNGTTSGTVNKINNMTGVKSRTTYDYEKHHDKTDDDFHILLDHDEDGGWTHSEQEQNTSGNDTKTGNNTVKGSRKDTSQGEVKNQHFDHTYTEDEADGSNSNINREAVKQAPMNASGVTITGSGDDAGHLANLDFNYASMYKQDDSKGKTHNHDENDVQNDGWSNDKTQNQTSGSYSDAHIINEGVDKTGHLDDETESSYHDEHDHTYMDQRDTENDGWKQKDGTVSDVNNATSSDQATNTGSNYEIKHDRYTGRDNVLPQDALKSAMNYLQNYSTAFEWLCNKLEINFIGIYDI